MVAFLDSQSRVITEKESRRKEMNLMRRHDVGLLSSSPYITNGLSL
jgi:hypothetical protein